MPRRVAWIFALALAVAAIAWGWLDVRQRARLDRGAKYHRTDFTVYTEASAALYRGDDPYDAKSPRGWRYVYPPLLAILFRPLTGIAVPDAAFVWYLLNVAMLVVAALATARSIGTSGVRSTAIALLLAAPFLVQTFQRGQVTILLLALQATAVLALLRGRDVLAGFLLAIGVALRLTPLLLAGMVGVACLRALVMRRWADGLRFPAGLALGLALAFVVVPVAALGPSRALDVSSRWIGVSKDVYASAPGGFADLGADYSIDERSFKNQSVRRVGFTWMGGRHDSPDNDMTVPREVFADRLSLGVALGTALLAVALALSRLRDRSTAAYRRALAIGIVLPVFSTRYVWPTHLVMLVPLLAESVAAGLARRRRLAAAGVLALATLAFYLDHLTSQHALAEFGVLLAGIAGATILLFSADLDPSRGQSLPVGDAMPVASMGGLA